MDMITQKMQRSLPELLDVLRPSLVLPQFALADNFGSNPKIRFKSRIPTMTELAERRPIAAHAPEDCSQTVDINDHIALLQMVQLKLCVMSTCYEAQPMVLGL